MKQTLLVVLLLLAAFDGFAQNCAPNGITTNPSAPVNIQRPSKTNTFNWLQENYPLYWVYDNTSTIKSPFYQLNNSITNHFIENKEMYPADGWELVAKDLGYNDDGMRQAQPIGNASIVFYNKHTGILRVFIARGDQQPFNGVRVNFGFERSSPMQTSLLSQVSELVPLDHFQRDPAILSVSQFNNDYQRWFYADFNMMYDPCTCLYTSKLHIDVYLVNTSTISLEGTSNGELVSIDNNQGTVKNNSNTWTLGKLADGSKKIGSFYKTLNSYREEEKEKVDKAPMDTNNKTQKKSAIESLANIINSSSFLKNGLGAFPFVGEAMSLLDFFVGGGKKSTGPADVKVMPMTLNMSSRYEGSITALYRYKDIIFWNPGSNNAGLNAGEYPYYNEVMGLFNLLETPKVNLQFTRELVLDPQDRFNRYTVTNHRYQLANDLKYVINPASGLEIQDMRLALIVEGTDQWGGPAGGGFPSLEGYNAESKRYAYRTNYVDLNCFRKEVFEIQASDAPGHINWRPMGSTYLKVMVNFKRKDADANTQNILFVAKYPVNIQNATNMNYALGCYAVPPQSAAAVQAYCQSSIYTSSARFVNYAERLNQLYLDEQSKKSKIRVAQNEFKVFPNPASTSFKLHYSVEEVKHVKIEIFDATGRLVFQVIDQKHAPGPYEIEIFTEQFKNGIYFVLVEDGRKDVHKLIINK